MSVTGDTLQLYVITKPFQPSLIKSFVIVRPSPSHSIYKFHYRLAFWLLRRDTYPGRPSTITWRLDWSLERRPTHSKTDAARLNCSGRSVLITAPKSISRFVSYNTSFDDHLFPSITRLSYTSSPDLDHINLYRAPYSRPTLK